jgi:CBS domain-containing protein
MKDEKVIKWMSADVITITPDTTLPQAYNLMKKFKIRRLPVVEFGKLVGVVTMGDVREAKPSKQISPSIYELNSILAALKINRIMSSNPITITTEETIGQAAKLMYQNKIGCLPVMEGDNLVGIITESDIFRVLAEGVVK